MITTLSIVLALWMTAPLLFCLSLCWAASRPMPKVRVPFVAPSAGRELRRTVAGYEEEVILALN